MLQFFRKYQKYFFIVITIVIVMTFVFFGTYQAFAPAFHKPSEEKSHLDLMVDFLNTEEWMVSQKLFADNFLNDGVISKEFLETGMAEVLVSLDSEKWNAFFTTMLEKEREYQPYHHPILPTLTAEAVWSIFSPDLPVKLKAHQGGSGSFRERKELFLAQKQFPPAFLSQVLRYQEQNSLRGAGDPRLAKDEMALFGYHTLSDWFGEELIRSMANQVINLAQLAKKLGFRVTKEELFADLISRSQEIYTNLKDKISLPVNDGYGFFQLYLNSQGVSEESLFKVWEEISLFRKLMQATGAAAAIDPLALSQFYAFAYENAEIELYQMPPELRFKSIDQLKQFEAYLMAVSHKTEPLDLPFDYAPLPTIESRAPELVGKRYHLSFAMVNQQLLQSKVSLKEMIQWECQPANWLVLQKQFPFLSQKKGEAFDILEGLDPKNRKLLDQFARAQIVQDHPEWITEMLEQAKRSDRELFITSAMASPFEGITDLTALSSQLEKHDELTSLTQDGIHFYHFVVNHRSDCKEILPFKVAKKEGILEKLVEKTELDNHITTIRNACPEAYKENPHLYRFAPFMAQQALNDPSGSLINQFLIEKKEKTITRAEPSLINLEEVLALEKGAFSTVKIDPTEGCYFFRFIDHKVNTTLPLEKMRQSQELLSHEVRCRYFEHLLKNVTP